MNLFESSFEYKLIYILKINDDKHEGLLKIGDATLKSNEPIDNLSPNCSILNKAALNRIKQYTNTVGVNPILLHTELAVKYEKNLDGNIYIKAFRDYNVHKVLENSNIKKETLDGSTSREWFRVDLETAIKAIDAVKKNYNNLSNSNKIVKNPIIFRPEQQDAIEKTLKQFKTGNKMLWNAKMRFGKTLSALEVVKRSSFKRTIIITHRPVVDNSWYEDFNKIFSENDKYIYGSKNTGYSVDELECTHSKYIYFASIQDLRGSDKVGGKFEKNDTIFEINWDCVIVDEAHEGTTTTLGDDVIKNIVKDNNGIETKFLALSGTPFNILREYDNDSIYTWDYIMEQTQKNTWNLNHFGDSNPYEELPELKIYTYDLGNIIGKENFIEIDDKAFNFREFFRVWTGKYEIDGKQLPKGVKIGDFYYESDVKSFLNLITKDDDFSNYPYSKKEYRDLFKHSLWMVPGVKEAKALSKLLKSHPVFGMGFEIINVAGEGDDEVKSEDALKLVKDAIKRAGENGYTITISCGKLTTGVTIPEWTSVMMLSGTHSTSAANYLQTIFRVQSPCNINGKIKTSSYVFDFAPDRTLKMVAESVAISTKAGKTQNSDRKILGEFLNYCPVIAIDGTKMKKYNTNNLLQQLKRAYAERAVQNGFDDTIIYNDELLKLDGIALEEFKELKGLIGTSKSSHKMNEIDINRQGFSDEEYEEKERIEKKNIKERTPEEQRRLDEIKEKNKNKKDAISILRGISIRMPLLIYGADVPITEDITIDGLPDLVDESSWKEFMPKNVTKEIFKKFTKYYDSEIFISAGRKIRNVVVSVDREAPLERVKKISMLFSCFKNPDKETVLTPWRVVNMHMGDCFGGYVFYDDNYQEIIEEPRYIKYKGVTENIFKNKDAKVLEINSKTGLYPLYIAYSMFKQRCEEYEKSKLTYDFQNKIWNEIIEKNIYVLCKTPMAKSITKRTLIGFKNISINAHYFNDLINMLENKEKQFIERISKNSYWKKGSETIMKFDAIVGNPPYQEMTSGYGTQAKPVYNLFVNTAKLISNNYVSLITPSRWFSGGMGLNDFRKDMLNDNRIAKIVDYPNSKDVFTSADIAGGVNYFLWKKDYNGECEVINVINKERFIKKRKLNEYNTFIRFNQAIPIVKKVFEIESFDKTLETVVSPQKPFGLPTNYEPQNEGVPCWFIQKIGKKYANPNDIIDDNNLLNKWKLLVPRSPIAGQTDFTKPVGFYSDRNTNIAKPGECCTESFIVAGAFDTEEEVINFKSYLFSKTVRFLLLQAVVSQDVLRNKYCFVPDLGEYDRIYTDKYLCKRWNITEEEWNYIDSRIK